MSYSRDASPVHEDLLRAGLCAPVEIGGAEERLWLDCDLASLAEGRLGDPTDPRQIDGVGGAHPLTSKVAVISPPSRPDADVDYLFLQVVVDKAEVSDSQNCGNILAGVGPFAIERGLVAPTGDLTPVAIGSSCITCERTRMASGSATSLPTR